MKNSMWQKRIPTLLGMGVLVVGLMSGVAYFTLNGGPLNFTPRAAPEATPRNIKLTNLTDTSFTVSFYTEEKTAGFVNYGTEAGEMKSRSGDDRDQLSGTVGQFNLHHITVRGLTPNTAYFYELGTAARNTFDDNGKPFTVKTAQRAGAPPAAQTTYGNVIDQNGAPATGAIVYLTSEAGGELSTTVKDSGSFALSLSMMRTTDGSSYAQLTSDTPITLTVQGHPLDQKTQLTTVVGKSQPVDTITLGTGGDAMAKTPKETPPTETTLTSTGSGQLGTPSYSLTNVATESTSLASPSGARGGLGQLAAASGSATATTSTKVVDVDSTKPTTVSTTQPTIIGDAPANATVTIVINSETTITQQVVAKPDGTYELDLAKLGQNLEPGEHTATVTFVENGKTVTKKVAFTVAGSSTTTQLAAAGTTRTATSTATSSTKTATSSTKVQPYGSGNPYPIGGATNSAQATSSTKTATTSSRPTVPSTSSAIPVSGSVGATWALVIGGLFFIIAGLWSFWLAHQLEQEYAYADPK